MYLQERINKERDRHLGKRSLSFTDEFEEYRNNTIKAAKRALLGPNPFNIGVHLPENFLLRKCPSDGAQKDNRGSASGGNGGNGEGGGVGVVTKKMSEMGTRNSSPSPRNGDSNEHFMPLNYHQQMAAQRKQQQQPQRHQGGVVLINNPVPLQPRIPYHPGIMLPINCRPGMPPRGLAPPRPQIAGSPMRAVRAVGSPVVGISGYAGGRQAVIVGPYNTAPEESIYMPSAPPDVSIRPGNSGKWLQIDKKTIRINRELGAGAFGKVYKGTWMIPGRNVPIPVAIKSIIDRHDPGYDKAVEDIRAEAHHLATLNNDNDQASHHIIKLYGMCVGDDGVYQIVEEFAQHGQLDTYIHKAKVSVIDLLLT